MLHNLIKELITKPSWEHGVILTIIIIAAIYMPELIAIIFTSCNDIIKRYKGRLVAIFLIISLALCFLYVYTPAQVNKRELQHSKPEPIKIIPDAWRHSA